MTITEKLEDVRKDYQYLFSIYGDAGDICGSFCNTEMYFKLLNNPTKKEAYNHYVDLVNFFFQGCFSDYNASDIIESDTRAFEIYEKYK